MKESPCTPLSAFLIILLVLNECGCAYQSALRKDFYQPLAGQAALSSVFAEVRGPGAPDAHEAKNKVYEWEAEIKR
jgi:hypothetical protein